jgi:hypothetical protein
MGFTEIMVQAIEGQMDEQVETELGYLHFEISSAEICVTVEVGTEKRRFIWERVMEVI